MKEYIAHICTDGRIKSYPSVLCSSIGCAGNEKYNLDINELIKLLNGYLEIFKYLEKWKENLKHE